MERNFTVDFDHLNTRISTMVASVHVKFKTCIAVTLLFKDVPENYSSLIVRGLRPVIYVGRILGALSRTDILCNEVDKRTITPALGHSVSLALFLFINAVLQVTANVKRYNDSPAMHEKLHELVLPGYACVLFFIQIYLLLNTGKLRKLVKRIMTLPEPHQVEIREDESSPTSFITTSNYPRFCLIALVGILVYGIIENVTYDLQDLGNADRHNVNTTVQRYYMQTLYHWTQLIPSYSWLTVLFVALLKCGTYTWILGDILVIVLCKAVSERLTVLHKQIQQSLNPLLGLQDCIPNQEKIPEKVDENAVPSISWDEVRIQYMTLKEITQEMGQFISPLMLSCYSLNIYLIVIHLFYWIAPNASFTEEQTFYSYFAFAHFFFRVSSVTYFVADVYHVGNSIVATIQKCPNSLYTVSLERLERSIIWNPCGISLFGTLIITRKFFISIVSFIFTTEIVLLQTAKSNS